MDAKDVDMMDSDAPVTSSSPVPPGTAELSSVSQQIEIARGLLTVARQLIDQGKPSQALQAVLTAMRAKGGEAAAVQTLNRANELYRNRVNERAADELASLFAECAIEEALPAIPTTTTTTTTNHPSIEPDAGGTSILTETGRKQIMVDAFSDGSSFVCVQCGGLVSNDRRDEHYAFWCGRV
ncbi:unnamed protein product [Lactuca saligna]|uniref:C2HC zinc finger plants domain-containing protein n=1 Tax=Lactuca saligna TaxID=75948 RepID=A0AA35V8U9_LACSI|nr:unnamed protein product [Lactuca saligna]